eukprot:6180052-Pleurochrysis_carterae.AAC.4
MQVDVAPPAALHSTPRVEEVRPQPRDDHRPRCAVEPARFSSTLGFLEKPIRATYLTTPLPPLSSSLSSRV